MSWSESESSEEDFTEAMENLRALEAANECGEEILPEKWCYVTGEYLGSTPKPYEEYVVQRLLAMPFEEVIAKHGKFRRGLQKKSDKAEAIRAAWGEDDKDGKLKTFLLDCEKKGMFGPLELTHNEINSLIECMRAKGVEFEKGLSDHEISTAEQLYLQGQRFPPDLRAFLQVAMPVKGPRVKCCRLKNRTESFPNWRDRQAMEVYRRKMDLHECTAAAMRDEILHVDVAKKGIWHPSWGEKPSSSAELRFDPVLGRAVTQQETHRSLHWEQLAKSDLRRTDLPAAKALVDKLIDNAPVLVPICGRRFMATEPHTCGQPVLSVFIGTDIIHYGYDLAYFLAREFDFDLVRPFPPKIQITIPFWGGLAWGRC